MNPKWLDSFLGGNRDYVVFLFIESVGLPKRAWITKKRHICKYICWG